MEKDKVTKTTQAQAPAQEHTKQEEPFGVTEFRKLPLAISVSALVTVLQVMFMGPSTTCNPDSTSIITPLLMEQVMLLFCGLWYSECAKKHSISKITDDTVTNTAWDSTCYGFLFSQAVWLPMYASYCYWCLANYAAISIILFDCVALITFTGLCYFL